MATTGDYNICHVENILYGIIPPPVIIKVFLMHYCCGNEKLSHIHANHITNDKCQNISWSYTHYPWWVVLTLYHTCFLLCGCAIEVSPLLFVYQLFLSLQGSDCVITLILQRNARTKTHNTHTGVNTHSKPSTAFFSCSCLLCHYLCGHF